MIMLYRIGTQMEWHGGHYDTCIVNEEEVEKKLKDGWFKHVNDIPNEDDKEPTREELEIKAKELNIQFDGRTSDKTLLAKIEEALNVG